MGCELVKAEALELELRAVRFELAAFLYAQRGIRLAGIGRGDFGFAVLCFEVKMIAGSWEDT